MMGEQTIAQQLPESPHWCPAHLPCVPHHCWGPGMPCAESPGCGGQQDQPLSFQLWSQASRTAPLHWPTLACRAVSFQGSVSIQRMLTQLSTSHPPDRSRCMNSGVDAGSCLSHHHSSVVLSTLPQQESQHSSPAFLSPLGLLLLGTPGGS